MKLSAIANAVSEGAVENHSILIYGPSKSGKTRLVGTAAELPELRRIFWIDNENGISTLLRMGLSQEALDKIEVISLPDTRDNPIAIETTLRMLTSKTPVSICEEHGKINCAACTKNKKPAISFCLSSLDHHDLVVIDSGSQLGDSALNWACFGQDVTYKPTFDDYGKAGKYLSDVLMVAQQCANTNFVVITHETLETDEINGVKRDKIYPLMGTRTFCRKVAKYFGTVVYTHMKAGKHAGGSSSTYRTDTLTGSRIGAVLEKASALDMRSILIAGGIFKEGVLPDVHDKSPAKGSHESAAGNSPAIPAASVSSAVKPALNKGSALASLMASRK